MSQALCDALENVIMSTWGTDVNAYMGFAREINHGSHEFLLGIVLPLMAVA